MKYIVSQVFDTENQIEDICVKSFSNLKDAKKLYNSIKDETRQGGCIRSEIFNTKTEDIVSVNYSTYDYSNDYGKLVIQYQHEGKGMNYCHKFLGAYWLDDRNCNLSDNPDNRFKLWETMTDLRIEDLNGLTYDEIVELICKEVHLKLNNSISLDGLGIVLAEEN